MSSELSRRSFIAGCALLAGAHASSATPPLFTTLKSNLPVRLGFASYTFRNFSRSQMIGYMQQLQVSALNAKDTRDHLPLDPVLEAIAVADYAAAGIKPHAAGAIYFDRNEDADIQSKFEYCKRANVGVIVAGDPAPDSLPRVERFAKQYDMRIAIHNHGPEDKFWQSPLDILTAIERYDARIGCCIDVGHTVRAGVDVVEAIHKVGPRLFNVHMKDLADFRDKGSQVAVGDGKMPVREIFMALAATRYRGFVDLEYEAHADDPMPGVVSSFAYMRGVLAGLGYGAQT